MFNTDAIYNISLIDKLIINYTNSQLNNWRGKKYLPKLYVSIKNTCTAPPLPLNSV